MSTLRYAKRVPHLVTVAVLAGAFAAVWLPARAATAEDVARPEKVVAAFPFADSSEGGRYAALAQAMGDMLMVPLSEADMLITDLSRSARFQVVTRREMVKLVNELVIRHGALPGQNRLESFTQAAKVAYVVSGTFELADGRLSVVAHVFDADKGGLKRVEMVSGPATNVFRTEKKVALQLVDRFDVELTAAERTLIEYMPTDNMDAAAHFYRGQDLHDRLRPFDALAELKMAVRQDPSYVAAGYMLARLYYTLCGSKHARIELGRVSRVPAEIPEVSEALIDFIRMPGDVDERVAACRMLRNRWYPLTEHESSPGGWASACAAKLLAEAGRFDEAMDQLRSTRLGSADRLDELMVGHRAVLRMSGNTKQGVPDGYAWPIILSRESPVVSGPFAGGRAVHGRQLDRRDEVWKMYFQAEQGYWFKSIRAEITVKPGRGKAGKGHYHGVWQPGMSSVVMRPLPGLLHNVGGCDVTMAEERGGSWLVAANVYPARSQSEMHILQTWDFMQWDKVATLREPLGNPRLVTAGARLYALFAIDYVGSYQSGFHLVISVRISRDGGLTWSGPNQIATWPTGGYSGTGQLFAAADDRGTLWAVVPVCGAVRIWSSRDLRTWTETKYTAPQVYNPRPGTSYNYWKSRLWQCGPDRYRLSLVATDQTVWWAASQDGQRWGPASVLSPLKHAANIASAGSDAAWVVHDNSLVRLRPRATGAKAADKGDGPP